MHRFAIAAVLALVACGGATPAPAPAPVDAPNKPVAAAPAAAPAVAPAQASAGNMRAVSVANLAADLDAGVVPVLIDVRTPAEYASGHVPGAILLSLPDIAQNLSELDAYQDQEVYLICQSGGRSGRAATLLAAAGFDTVNVEGGTGGWIAAGHPVEQ